MARREERLKYWKNVRARLQHVCDHCGAVILKGSLYYRETIDYVSPSPGTRFEARCLVCIPPDAALVH